MAKIVWAEPALSDLEAIAEYIALDKPEAAARFVQRVFARVEKLAMHPELGSAVRELLPSSRYRQIVEGPCRVFYRYDKQKRVVYLLAVMRGEKLFQRGLLEERDAKPES